MNPSEEFSVIAGKKVVVEHADGWRYVIETSKDDDGDFCLYDLCLEELDADGAWVRASTMYAMWDESFPALAEAFRYLSPEEEK